MEKVTTYRTYITQLLEQLGAELPSSSEVDTEYIFDTAHDHYQLFQVGWEQYQWIHGCIVHVDIKNNKIWIQHNGTELPLAEEFVSLGVPKEDIVLGFQAPYKRKYTGYAEQ
ncbi:XisI protein [Candidatus Moduliflexus flocculans]|uniref:XisI protein n=1 Tax=Candidatus Moduliflexus flocculans TaxID=1499966 RepID=A0A081BSA9_9BACT|nr:XisI protein [Candidatus Moduliflexus flocculans]